VGEEVRPFSAVAYFFAKQLHQKYQIPIGIINASVGGTPIEAWISEEGLPEIPNMKELVKK
jgi:sialate O-acetylesterase